MDPHFVSPPKQIITKMAVAWKWVFMVSVRSFYIHTVQLQLLRIFPDNGYRYKIHIIDIFTDRMKKKENVFILTIGYTLDLHNGD